jgi:hypothetical protein
MDPRWQAILDNYGNTLQSQPKRYTDVISAVNAAATDNSFTTLLGAGFTCNAIQGLSATIKETNGCGGSCAQSRSKELAAILPGTGANPYFDGHNVTRFLERFERLQKLYYPDEDDAEKIERLCHNVADELAPRIKFIAGGSCEGWDYFTKRLLRAYRDQDPVQMKGSKAYLRQLSSVIHEEPRDILNYYYEFGMASEMIPADDLGGPHRARIFSRGLATDAREMAERWFQTVASGPGDLTVVEFAKALRMSVMTWEHAVDEEEMPRKKRRLQ